MIDTDQYEGLHIDDLDGAVTLFKSTEEGTETIAVFDEEHREVIQDLLVEVRRLRVEVKALRKAQGYDMKFPAEVHVIDELLSENRQLRGMVSDLREWRSLDIKSSNGE
tara:strand:+ start:389 stop:715 length:327 start_codon:yes stop_codon:yes gene_type:complete